MPVIDPLRRAGDCIRSPSRESQRRASLRITSRRNRRCWARCWVNNKAYERVSEFLRREHFSDPFHRRIYQASAR